MDFPNPFSPDLNHRAGRMMEAGRVKVTMTGGPGNGHVTILLNAFADNRDRQYKADANKNWVSCPLADATHVFCEVPRPDGGWADKVGTFYPRTGRWYDADNADPVRVFATKAIAQWIVGNTPQDGLEFGGFFYRFQEADECGTCGRELTDPISIERGTGPTCYGRETGSQHQVKGTTQISGDEAHSPGADSMPVWTKKEVSEEVSAMIEEGRENGVVPDKSGLPPINVMADMPEMVADLSDVDLGHLMRLVSEEMFHRVQALRGDLAEAEPSYAKSHFTDRGFMAR